MILADEITCHIADPNAVKVDLINCSTSLIDSAKGLELMWMALGAMSAFGAMIITLFMARYAWKAWNTAKKQLEHSENEAILNRRQAALIDFLRILRSYFYDSEISKSGALSGPSVEEVRFASDLWLLSHPVLVKEDSLWRLLVGLDAVLKKMKATHSVLKSEDIRDYPQKLRDQLEEVHFQAMIQARYVFDEVNRVSLELHRGERSELETATYFGFLDNATESALRKMEDVSSL